ncbi:hypothetical protein BH09ACT10_BH09ACT10_02540 [soil metagenome]
MSAGHGSSPAAWSGVTLALIGTTIAGIALIPTPHWVFFSIGCAVIVLAGIVTKVMSAAGLGASTPGHR